MAGYREHITVSGLLGVGYGFASVVAFGYSAVQASVAAVLTWVAGMLPDLDSESGRPVRELFGLMGALAPLMFVQQIRSMGADSDRTMLFALLLYGVVRYGGAGLLARVTVHRGMFHSIPALIIAAELTYLCYHSDSPRVRLLMAGGVALGFLSHLVLDEMYSVRWDGARIKLARSAGSALKFWGDRPLPNGLALGLVMFFSYATLVDTGILLMPGQEPAPEVLRVSGELTDAPRFLLAEQPDDSVVRQ